MITVYFQDVADHDAKFRTSFVREIEFMIMSVTQGAQIQFFKDLRLYGWGAWLGLGLKPDARRDQIWLKCAYQKFLRAGYIQNIVNIDPDFDAKALKALKAFVKKAWFAKELPNASSTWEEKMIQLIRRAKS